MGWWVMTKKFDALRSYGGHECMHLVVQGWNCLLLLVL